MEDLRFVRNSQICEFAQRLGRQEPNWDEVWKEINRSGFLRHGRFEDHHYEKALGHAIIGLALRNVGREMEGISLESGIVRSSIFGDYDAFVERNGRISFRSLSDGKIVSVCDYVVRVGEIPVVVNSGLVAWSGRRNTVASKLGAKNLQRVHEPIKQFYQTDKTGNVLVIFRDDLSRDSTPNVENYLDSGGAIVPFYANRDSFGFDAERFRRDWETY